MPIDLAHIRECIELEIAITSDQAIQLCDEVEQWRASFDGYPRHPEGLNANEFISKHNRMVIEWRKEIASLREAFEHTHVACKPGQIDPPGYPDKCQECGFDIRNQIHKRIPRSLSAEK